MCIFKFAFKRSWTNTGLVKQEELDEDVEDFEDIDVADYILEKEEEEMLVEHFLALQLEENEAPARMDVQEQAPIQIIDEKSTRTPSSSDAPKNNSKSQAFLSNCRKFFAKIKCHLKTGLSLENFRMTDFDEISQNRP